MSLFFYGTLLHPQILTRVIGNDGTQLKAAPTILPGFTRHHVKKCDYPAIAPYESTKALFNRELTQNECSVRGTVVSGFTEQDLTLLDTFEGDEYTRQTVSITPLAPFVPLLDSIKTVISPETSLPGFTDLMKVQTYIWDDGLDRLAPELWSFDVFVKEKLWRWVGKGSTYNSDYAIVDERRALNGFIKSSHAPEVNEPPKFGRALLPQFYFDKDYVNLNHGSFGSLPRPVFEAVEALSFEVESNPDKFMRKTYVAKLIAVRERLARLIGAETDEVVMVPNATHGINTVLRNFIWEPEDVLVETTTTYNAISRTVQYIHDLPPHPAISNMNLTFPSSHAAIVKQFRAHLRAIPRKPGQKVLAVIDTIVSNPGCVLPWEEMVKVCKEENVWSLVDAAHSIGQQINIDLGKSKPDFWISNCHKWLFAKRGSAVLYVPLRNQHIIQSSFPTSFGYVSPDDPRSPGSPQAPNFVAQFEWTGTIDLIPYLSVNAALDFREKLGGETHINEYCHTLALKGGKRLAQLLQTRVIDDDGGLTANMVNVLLPLPVPAPDEREKLRVRIEDKLLEEWNCFVPVFAHDEKWWVRCSAQVWNELADFNYVGNALNVICAELRG